MADNKNMIVWIIAILAIAIAFDVGGIGTKVGGFFKGSAPAPSSGIDDVNECYVDKTTLTIGPAKSFYNGSSLTTAGHRLVLNGIDKGMYTDGDTVSVSPGDKVDLYYCYNDTPNFYATTKDSFEVTCKGAITSSSLGSSAGKCYPNIASNGTMKLFNEDNGNLNADTDNE